MASGDVTLSFVFVQSVFACNLSRPLRFARFGFPANPLFPAGSFYWSSDETIETCWTVRNSKPRNRLQSSFAMPRRASISFNTNALCGLLWDQPSGSAPEACAIFWDAMSAAFWASVVEQFIKEVSRLEDRTLLNWRTRTAVLGKYSVSSYMPPFVVNFPLLLIWAIPWISPALCAGL